MCTVSFLPAHEGFYLAMNRDELRTRAAALPPSEEIISDSACRAVYPREPGGGTWVAVNAAGLVFALLNWYSHPSSLAVGTRSRGEVIPALAAAEDSTEAARQLARLPLGVMGPFRLVVVSRREKLLREWCSGGNGALRSAVHAWRRTHWFSSSVDEREANLRRHETCLREAWVCPPSGAGWLRGLHSSHHPSKGPFSICMHRRDAATVSCTEISVGTGRAVMTYSPGSPCQQGASFQVALALHTARSEHALPG